MGTLFRRFAVLAALMFWQGGFTFYAAVVVPVGQHALHSPLDQALITREVAIYLNLSGAAALLLLAWDAAISGDPSWRRRRLRWLSWVGMVVALGLLVWLHPRLDSLFDRENVLIQDYPTFRVGHRWYLWISSVQWGCGVAYALLTLRAWREEDRCGITGTQLVSGRS